MFVWSKGKPKVFNPIKDIKNSGMNKRRNRSDLRRHHRNKEGDIIYEDKGISIKDYRMRENIWFYGVGFNKTTKDKIAFQHPAIFPDQLAHDHIISWSNEGDTILDPFMGSGTTAVACKRTGRNFIGCDLEQKYVDIANKRLKECL
jgi:site-specific DNA-methyltransferase (adenine-specific)